MGDHAMILLGLGLSVVAAYTAFLSNWITLDATKAVIILGTMVLGLGGWPIAGSILLFFVASSYLTLLHEVEYAHKQEYTDESDIFKTDKRRDGYQIWANGFWVAIFCSLWFALGSVASLVAAFTVVAAATADTWATEIGTLKPGKTWKIITFERVEPGTEGGISFKGTSAAFLGALIIALFIFFTGILSAHRFFWVIFLVGVTGALIDSVIGALFLDKKIEISAPDDFSSTSNSFTNSFINWISTGISGLAAYLITQLILL